MTTSELLAIQSVEPADTAAESRDRVLLSRLRRREPSAFEELVRTHQDRVFDFCVRMLSDREEASDLTQDVFLAVHAHVGSFREDARLGTWLFRIAKNHCLNRLKYLKRRGRGRQEALSEVSEQALADAHGAPAIPDDALVKARERQRVQAAIAQLEPQAKALVALRDIEGLSYEELVLVLELPLGTVKSRLHRARERLAELLGEVER